MALLADTIGSCAQPGPIAAAAAVTSGSYQCMKLALVGSTLSAIGMGPAAASSEIVAAG